MTSGRGPYRLRDRATGGIRQGAEAAGSRTGGGRAAGQNIPVKPDPTTVL
jgi:hypothetical protein